MEPRRESLASTEDTLGPMANVGKKGPPPAGRRNTLMPRKSVAAGMPGGLTANRPSIYSIKKFKHQEVKYENTYRMEPSDDEKFMHSRVKPLIYDIISSSLKDSSYDAASSGATAKTLTEYIRDRIKDEGFDRYKFVVTVFIGTKDQTNVSIASRAIWAPDMGDTYLDVEYSQGNLYVLAIVHAFYFD